MIKKKPIVRYLISSLLIFAGVGFHGQGSWAQTETTKPAEQNSGAKKLIIKILEKGTGLPLKRVEITVGNSKVFTDKNGLAEVEIPAGTDAVRLYRNSFEIQNLNSENFDKKELTVYLFPATPADNEVIIRGAKRPETSRKTVSIEEAKKVAPGGDPAQIPKLLPGVQSNRFQPTIIVRGSGPFDSKYFIDDWSTPFIFHRIGNISIIPDQILSDVEFSSGGFGAQYGGATGGVVTLKTKNEVPEHAKTEFRVNLPVYSSIYHERPVEDNKAMVAVSARRSYLDKILPLVIPKNQELTLVPYFGDAHVYYYRPTDDGHFKALGLHAYDGLKLLFNSEFSDNEDGRGEFNLLESTSLLGFEWARTLGDGWSMTSAPQISLSKSKTAIVGNRVNVAGNQISVNNEFTKRLESKDKIYAGNELSLLEGRADVLAPRPDFDDPFFDFEESPKVSTKVVNRYLSGAAWLIYDWMLGDLFLTPGFRSGYTTQLKDYYVDPRLNMRYKLTETNALKLAVGKYSQAPQFRETSDVFGNPDLNFIRSYHYILGIETNWSDRWTTDFQTFYKETLDMVRSDSITNTNNDGSLISYGFEAFIRRNLTQRFFGWLSYTYSVTRERDNDEETYRNSQYDQTHVANLASNYKLTATWDLGGRIIYHTGDTYTRVDDAVYNANLDKYQPRSDSDSRVNNGRLPAYHEIDIYGDKAFLFDTWKMGLKFGIEYLALKPQATNVQYNYDYSEEEYFTGLPWIPYIELRGVL